MLSDQSVRVPLFESASTFVVEPPFLAAGSSVPASSTYDAAIPSADACQGSDTAAMVDEGMKSQTTYREP